MSKYVKLGDMQEIYRDMNKVKASKPSIKVYTSAEYVKHSKAVVIIGRFEGWNEKKNEPNWIKRKYSKPFIFAPHDNGLCMMDTLSASEFYA